MHMASNHFGHMLLTVHLLPALQAAHKESGKCSRVIVLSSGAHNRTDILWDDCNFTKSPEKCEA